MDHKQLNALLKILRRNNVAIYRDGDLAIQLFEQAPAPRARYAPPGQPADEAALEELLQPVGSIWDDPDLYPDGIVPRLGDE